MLLKIGYEQLIVVNPSKEQVNDIEEKAGKSIVISDCSYGLSLKGEKADLYELLCSLSFKYDLEVN